MIDRMCIFLLFGSYLGSVSGSGPNRPIAIYKQYLKGKRKF